MTCITTPRAKPVCKSLRKWRTLDDLNHRPLVSEISALSSGLEYKTFEFLLLALRVGREVQPIAVGRGVHRRNGDALLQG